MRLRKFNESNNIVDLEYIKECFLDIIDDGFYIKIDLDIDDFGSPIRDYCNVYINISPDSLRNFEKVEEKDKLSTLANAYEKSSNMFKDVEVSINRIKIKYPDLEQTTYLQNSKINIIIRPFK